MTMERYRGYAPKMEHGAWVFRKSTKYKKMDINGKGEPILMPQDVIVVHTGTPDYDEACRRLDRRLTRTKEPKEDLSGNHRMDF